MYRMTVVPARSSYLHEPGFQLSQYPTQSDPQQPHYPTQPNPQLPGSKERYFHNNIPEKARNGDKKFLHVKER